MQRMLMKIAHHEDMVRAKPIAQIPDEHGRSPDVPQHLGLSDCWLSQDVLLLQHPSYTAHCLPFPWGQLWSHCISKLRQTHAMRVRMAWFL